MSPLADHLLELIERRRLYLEQNLSGRTTDPLSGKRGFVPRDPFPSGASEDDFSAFGARTGIELPEDVKQWLRITNGAGGFFGINTAHRDTDIEWLWQLNPQFRQEGWIPVGNDAFGNYFVRVLPKSGGRGGVFHVEATMAHELEYVVASDTLHLAEFVLEEREVLNSGKEYGWPLDKVFVLAKDPELAHVEGARFIWDM